MGRLLDELTAALPAALTVPPALTQLYEWIESRGLYRDGLGGARTGFLSLPDESGEVDGTDIEFSAPDGLNWIVAECGRPDATARFCEFARTGADGSIAALWLRDDGRQVIVHVGSGSGSEMFCVLADDPVDFLRLLAIGYEEICWPDEYADPPESEARTAGDGTAPNASYRAWVIETFGVDVPARGADVIPDPAVMDDDATEDPFSHWAFDLNPSR